ncbi:MAG: 50S ribosomal protein L29 [Candidatus Aenigmarchaeota archaeon]|nr:50S ribosomal protein L29 [Candidatus Aenigmarchaeota archaeon]MDI6722038.1 50S ribosomal protein L29 [Candidatus Aenigmarchaeota archaeon]
MAILKMKKIREMDDKEIDEKFSELKLEISKEIASSEIGGTVKNPGRIREIKRTIARIKTYRNKKGGGKSG